MFIMLQFIIRFIILGFIWKSTTVQRRIVTKFVSNMFNHFQPWSHRRNYGHPWSTMVQHLIVTQIVSIWRSPMVNHCPSSHCNKHCLNIKINYGQPYSNFILWQLFILGFILLWFIIFIPWVYNINPLALILFHCVYIINPFGL